MKKGIDRTDSGTYIRGKRLSSSGRPKNIEPTVLNSQRSTAGSSTRVSRADYKKEMDIENLSLHNVKKPKPQKLKPLPQAPKVTKLAETDTVESRRMMLDLENDMSEYLNYNNIVSEMHGAFNNSHTPLIKGQ